MKKDEIKQAIKSAKESSPKRNFKQSGELIVNLKGLLLKKQENQVSTYVSLHYNTGNKI